MQIRNFYRTLTATIVALALCVVVFAQPAHAASYTSIGRLDRDVAKLKNIHVPLPYEGGYRTCSIQVTIGMFNGIGYAHAKTFTNRCVVFTTMTWVRNGQLLGVPPGRAGKESFAAQFWVDPFGANTKVCTDAFVPGRDDNCVYVLGTRIG